MHGLLDVARQTYKEANDDVYKHVEDLNSEYLICRVLLDPFLTLTKEEHDVTAELKYDSRRKFWLRIRRSDVEDRVLPDVFINFVQKGIWFEFQTITLIQLNNRITDSHNEAVMLSDKVIQELLDGVRAHAPDLFRVCEGLALLDMIASFGQVATTRDYVRPEIDDTLALQGGRHPICERVC